MTNILPPQLVLNNSLRNIPTRNPLSKLHINFLCPPPPIVQHSLDRPAPAGRTKPETFLGPLPFALEPETEPVIPPAPAVAPPSQCRTKNSPLCNNLLHKPLVFCVFQLSIRWVFSNHTRHKSQERIGGRRPRDR